MRFHLAYVPLLAAASLAHAQVGSLQIPRDSRVPVELSKVVVNLPTGAFFGTAKGGSLCISEDKFLWQTGTAPKLEVSALEQAFREDIRSLGFRGLQDPKDLFAGVREGESNYIVAGRIDNMDLKLCYPNIGLGNEQVSKGRASVQVTWQIYSRSAGKVVSSFTVTGNSIVPKSQPGGPHTVLLAAFADTIRQFTEQPEFRAIYGSPVAPK